MSAMKLLLSHARRHGFTSTTAAAAAKPHSSFRPFAKSLSSESNSDPDPNPRRQSQSVPIQPVSYAVKPKDETDAPNPPRQDSQSPPLPPPQQTRTSWTREEVRYLKDALPSASISPVSYPTRVAPLPEDRVAAKGEAEKTDEMEIESKRIESENVAAKRRLFRMVQQEEQEVKVPFPTLIKVEKKEKKAPFDLNEALRLIKANAKAKFDETVEAHVRLGIVQNRSDLIVRGTMTLPHGASKAARVAVFAEGADADEARAAGADIVGGIELVEEIANSGKINFEKCFTTQQFMPRLFKISKVLNKHGLMPNPKLGTVTTNFTRAVKEAQKNQIKFKMDKSAIVHVGLGKVSFAEAALRENIGAFMNALLLAKPSGLKKTSKYAGYVNSFHICTTMSPGFPVSIQSLSKAVDHYNSKMLLN